MYEVNVLPKSVAGKYGHRVCFNCTTTHVEAHWKVEDENGTIDGNADSFSIGGRTVTVSNYCFNVTRNMRVTCYGETPSRDNSILPGTDTGEVILLSEGYTSNYLLFSHHCFMCS